MDRFRIRFACSILLLAAATQIARATPERRLKDYPSEQLIACFKDAKVCGSSDVYAITDVLIDRLPKLAPEKVAQCFKDWKVCGVENDIEDGWAVSRELQRRGYLQPLIARYPLEKDILYRDGVVHAAYLSDSPEALAFLKRVFKEGEGDEDTLYWPADYLAKRCDPSALAWLSERKGRPEGCIVFEHTVKYFGKCHYRPAIPYLVNNSLHDACLNVVDGAAEDLRMFYPHGPKTFDSIGQMQNYFCVKAHDDGYRVDCSQNER